MIGLGIAWASAVGVPYLMVATMVPAKRTGVYMGILNMMIVVPMLIQTVTFGWIFEHLLDSKGTNAIMLAGVLLGCGAIAMLWVNPPDEADESPIVPLGGARHHGLRRGRRRLRRHPDRLSPSTGPPMSRTRPRPGWSWSPPTARATPARCRPVEGMHRDLYGVEAARGAGEVGHGSDHGTGALHRAAARRGDPAQALLDTAGANPANLIVVGNRGLGAGEGQLLGSVPARSSRTPCATSSSCRRRRSTRTACSPSSQHGPQRTPLVRIPLRDSTMQQQPYNSPTSSGATSATGEMCDGRYSDDSTR